MFLKIGCKLCEQPKVRNFADNWKGVLLSGRMFRLEAFAMNNGRTRFIVFFLRNPHLLEGGQRGQDGSSDPYRVFALRRSNDLDLHCGWSQSSDFFLHSVSNSREHGGATRQHCVGVQVLTDVHVALHDGIICGLVDTGRFHSKERGLEHGLGTPEAFVANGDDLSIGKLVTLFQAGVGSSSLHFLLEVESNIAKFFFDVTHDLTFGCGGEGVATLGQNLHEVICQVPAGQVKTKDGMGKSVTFVDGNCVTDAITAVKHNTSGTTRGVQRQHSLDCHVHGWRVESLEHNLVKKIYKRGHFS